jgi:hypothetical protein
MNATPAVVLMLWLLMQPHLSSTPMVGILLTSGSNKWLMLLQGATNYRGDFVFTGEGQGNDTAPALYVMNPREPYNTTGMTQKASYSV